jgi:hypothetical protein
LTTNLASREVIYDKLGRMRNIRSAMEPDLRARKGWQMRLGTQSSQSQRKHVALQDVTVSPWKTLNSIAARLGY